MKKLIMANWKMSSLVQESKTRVKKLATLLKDYNGNAELVICPSSLQLPIVAEQLEADKFALLGSQDCHYKEKGAFTGDISAKMVKEIGCSYVILGHAERRSGHFETDEIVKNKAERALENSLIPVICVGEGKDGIGAKIKDQLPNSLPKTGVTGENLVVAHEPLWAIGASVIPTAQEIETTHKQIRDILKDLYGEAVAKKIRILYGGSVTSNNAKEILSLQNVDGVLVGGASLLAEDLSLIVKSA